ncbi:MAG: hypothetical protein J2P25_09475 [Nocardiopsaceae bacterium]|nr:hypothetical protein [Nocardiopsaceae bacterium]
MPDTPTELLADLRDAGCEVASIWDLVNAKYQYKNAIPVLIDWLENLDSRVPDVGRAKLREGLTRALTVRAARPAAIPVLLREFKAPPSQTDPGARWAVGNALSVVADDSVFDELAALVRERSYGTAPQMVVLSLGRSKNPAAGSLLVSLLDDDDVLLQALSALGRLKPAGARPAVEKLLDHPRAPVRKAAKQALARLPD